jgi:hypothetical protein|tara:strand:- start:224 stop:676 length:453 start_codon:yes stop_codon:yes gene_type:complete
MRVKIQYSVELDEVPEHAAELIEDECGTLSFCDHTISELCSVLRQEDPNLKFSIKKIDKVRQMLAAFDNRLMEMQNLLEGYDAAINPPIHPVMAPPQPAAVEESPLNPDDSPLVKSGRVDPETSTYQYEPSYSMPVDDTFSDEESPRLEE